MDLGLTGRRALITGASKGIGFAIARRLADEGAAVAVCARGEAGVKEAANKLASTGTPVHAAAVDVRDGDALRAFVADAADVFGGLDIVVHTTSASAQRGPEQWQASFEIDLMPFVHLVEAAQPLLETSDAAAMVAIGNWSAIAGR
jgi:NAD(P)-dependent dehydrogenase (short-subunit alcohol dehydrogenase family)